MTQAPRQCRAFLLPEITKKNDYNGMSRIIDDTTYAEIVKILATDPKVAVFQKLLLSPKVEEADAETAVEEKTSEVEK